MNAAEIEEAISALVEQPFDQAGFPFAFLDAFGNKEATIDKLKKGASNKSDIERRVLQCKNSEFGSMNDEISHFQPDVNKLTELCRSKDLFKTLKARF